MLIQVKSRFPRWVSLSGSSKRDLLIRLVKVESHLNYIFDLLSRWSRVRKPSQGTTQASAERFHGRSEATVAPPDNQVYNLPDVLLVKYLPISCTAKIISILFIYSAQRNNFVTWQHVVMTMSCFRSYLKLYTSMPMEKLAKYMNTTVDELESNLLCFKHKMMNVVWTKGTSALQGEFQSESEVFNFTS